MNTQITNITLGTDPEVFMRNKITKEIISAVGIIPGTKDSPHPITDEGHAIQRDNCMAEFCVPPAKSAKKLYTDIKKCLDYLDNNISKKLEVYIAASAFLKKEQLLSEESQEFGWTQPII